MSSPEYWIWLQSALGIGARADELIAQFGDARGVYNSSEKQRRISGAATPKQIEKMSQASLECANGIISVCAKNGWTIVTPESDYYPAGFRMMADYPLVLYVNGDVDILKRKACISIVGTRQASRYGIEVTRRLSAQIAASGAVIVSGGALGVDSAAHSGAIIANGKTIAFLGCGLSSTYLMENEPLRREISKNGAVVSEFQPATSPTRSSFPIRNRLISGMSLGTIVIEAGEKSGSLITARRALEQGRDVFAVPGNIISSAYTGANKLIREGAKPVFSAADVLEEYALLYGDEITMEKSDFSLLDFGSLKFGQALEIKTKPQKTVKAEKSKKTEKSEKSVLAKNETPVIIKTRKKSVPDSLTPMAKKVYDVFDENEIHIDELAQRLNNASVGDILSALTELELYSLIESKHGRRYALVYE